MELQCSKVCFQVITYVHLVENDDSFFPAPYCPKMIGTYLSKMYGKICLDSLTMRQLFRAGGSNIILGKPFFFALAKPEMGGK
jgi:hypothetical protein